MIKSFGETNKNEAKEQKNIFLRISIGILAASLLENLLKGKGIMRAGEDKLELAKIFKCYLNF